MIKSVDIKDFKGLNEINLKDLSMINLFGGKNNAGKTSILEALFMFYDRLNPNMLLRQYNWRGISELSLTPETLFAPIFNNFDLNKEIFIEVRNEKSLVDSMKVSFKEDKNISIQSSNNYGHIRTDESPVIPNYLSLEYAGSTHKRQEVKLILDNNGIQLNAENASTHGIRASFLASKSHSNPHENAVIYGELDIKGQTGIIIKCLQIIEPRLIDISTVALPNGTTMLYANIGLGKKVPISYMGDGISRLLSIILRIVSMPNGVLLIDEIENGIHYSTLPKIWEIISTAALEYNCQIFATTHSYECLNSCLDGIVEDCKGKFRYIRVERAKDGDKIIPKNFDYEVLESAIDRGWEVR
ncbi:AAA family ATPase [Niallia sp. FSL K6-0212]|uniref:AAA family ATPase n=1 Tax=Niallia sp. FSL K6-0212 TaxID=2921423 RepID=UPI0030FC81CD